jgi:hypothetical protein
MYPDNYLHFVYKIMQTYGFDMTSMSVGPSNPSVIIKHEEPEDPKDNLPMATDPKVKKPRRSKAEMKKVHKERANCQKMRKTAQKVVQRVKKEALKIKTDTLKVNKMTKNVKNAASTVTKETLDIKKADLKIKKGALQIKKDALKIQRDDLKIKRYDLKLKKEAEKVNKSANKKVMPDILNAQKDELKCQVKAEASIAPHENAVQEHEADKAKLNPNEELAFSGGKWHVDVEQLFKKFEEEGLFSLVCIEDNARQALGRLPFPLAMIVIGNVRDERPRNISTFILKEVTRLRNQWGLYDDKGSNDNDDKSSSNDGSDNDDKSGSNNVGSDDGNYNDVSNDGDEDE